MASARALVPFIYSAEGGLSSDPRDPAAKHPCPLRSKTTNQLIHTNKGITWSTWESVHGDGIVSCTQFITMTDDDWFSIFKPLYWDVALADKINSQKVANMIVDFIWGSGKHEPEKDIQEVLNSAFNERL